MNKVHVTIDRPLGSRHPKHHSTIYPINYGYVAGIIGGDGDYQDAYIIGVDKPIDSFDGFVIAVVHRKDDNETKWIVAAEGLHPTIEEIEKAIEFQEKFYNSSIEMIK